MLEIKNLQASHEGRALLTGLDLVVRPGEVHAIMGPNGAGKSTLSKVLSGSEDYDVTGGTVTWNGKDLLAMPTEERAGEGVFLGFQYPVEIPGVTNDYFLRTAINAQRKRRGGSRKRARRGHGGGKRPGCGGAAGG
jgi:Fe-S cluster assembly ATP-binding protein